MSVVRSWSVSGAFETFHRRSHSTSAHCDIANFVNQNSKLAFRFVAIDGLPEGIFMRCSPSRRTFALLCLAALPLAFLASPSRAQVSVGVSINLAPPALPVYVQPAIPAPGYIWTPGYWAWGASGYYWVPGTWVAPPTVGLLWTPGWWGWSGGVFLWHAGYWGPHIGFYGGVNYGFGYTGHGYWGGEWRGGTFVYNRSVTNVTNVNVTNVYSRTVVDAGGPSHVSFNGGPGGIVARPTQAERAAALEHHVAFTPIQRQHVQMAARDPALRASVNGGRPAVAATARAGAFSGQPRPTDHGAAPKEHRGGAAPKHPRQAHPNHGGREPQRSDQEHTR